MRLHGKRDIMRYLGRSPQNKNGWRKIREHYADVIRCYSPSGHLFALSEDLDRIDRERCTAMREVLNAGGEGRRPGESRGRLPTRIPKAGEAALPAPGGVSTYEDRQAAFAPLRPRENATPG